MLPVVVKASGGGYWSEDGGGGLDQWLHLLRVPLVPLIIPEKEEA